MRLTGFAAPLEIFIMDSTPAAIYVEFLTVPHLIKNILPVLRGPSAVRHLRIFDTTKSAFLLSRMCGRVFGFNVEEIDFQMADARDDQGACVFLKVRYQELRRLQALILEEAPVGGSLKEIDGARLEAYLTKAPVSQYDLYGHGKHSELGHALVLTGVAQWHAKSSAAGPAVIHLYMYDRPFWKALARYTDGCGVIAHNMGAFPSHRSVFKEIWSFCKKIELRLVLSLLHHPGRLFFKKSAPGKVPGPARMMVEYFGQFNIDRPECVSDLFFIGPEGIRGEDICLVFNSRIDPVDGIKWGQMSERGITAVARTVQSSLVDEGKVPVFRHEFKSFSTDGFPAPWRADILEYRKARDYWGHFFHTYDIKLWTASAKHDVVHMAMADAISDTGGISSVYQKSYESNPSPVLAVGSDLIFGFSLLGYGIHFKSGSDFRYHITVGYVGDGKFERLRPIAQKIRQRLFQQGARRIIAYFDNSSIEDGRWLMGHKKLRENYAFWLNKLLEDQELGIVFKPKAPGTLRKRLGPVADLLRTAERTGRCYVFDEGVIHGAFPPAAAAMAADIAIQDCLWAGTAGVEAALAGAKTLLLDIEGWPQSPLQKLGPNVVFKDQTGLWSACQDHWKTPGGNPALGDWSPMLDDIDPFRDGKAALRMSQFLKWMLDDLRAGKKREAVMDDAVARYAGIWGADKVRAYESR